MAKIMSVNAGSSSLKFQLFQMPEEEVLTSGVVERIGLAEGIFTIKVNGEKHSFKQPIENHSVAVDLLLKALVEYGVVAELSEINALFTVKLDDVIVVAAPVIVGCLLFN